MAREIDERVVEMRFDNKQFKEGAKETLNWLERLKSSLNLPGSTKAFEQINKSVKDIPINGLISGIEALEKRFSTLGIVGMRVIENLTDSMMSFVTRGLNFVTDSIVSGGIRRAMNIENAHFQLQALLKDEIKVQEVMDNAMQSVDGTAYAYDEAAKAASMFAASGIEAGDDMLQALRGIVGVSAMTNSEFQSIAQIFTTVAGNGRLMGDQLLQLSSRGLNAASTIADFVNRVNSGTADVSDDIKQIVKQFSTSTKMTEGDIRDLVSKGEVNFKLFSSAMTEAFADSAERANETFTGAFSNMKSALSRIGAEFVSPLVAQNSEVIGLFNSLRLKINEFKKGITMDGAIGDFDSLSTRFTSAILRMSKSVSKFVDEADLSTPLEIFYHWVGVVENVSKGLFIYLRPIAEAFSDIFLSFSSEDINKISATFEKVTSKFRLTHKQAKNLKDAFSGLFSVGKLLVDIFIKLVQAIIPVNKPVLSLGDLLLSLAGAGGRALSSFTDWVRSSPKLVAAYHAVSEAIRDSMTWLSKLIGGVYDFGKAVKSLPVFQEAVKQINNLFKELDKLGDSIFNSLANGFKKLGINLKKVVPEDATVVLNELLQILQKLNDRIMAIDTSKAVNMLNRFAAKSKELWDILSGSKGLNDFLHNMVEYLKRMGDAIRSTDLFSLFDQLRKGILNIQDVMEKFVKWVGDVLGPVFSDFSFGGAVAAGGGIGMIISLMKVAKSLSQLSDSVQKIPSVFGALSGALKAYAKDMQADALMKNAKAILILAAALVVLSFTDTQKVMEASLALSAIASVLFIGANALTNSLNAFRTVDAGISNMVKNIGKGIKQLGKALKWQAVASVVKSFGKTILMIVGSIIALALVWRKDPRAIEEALKIVGIIAAAMVGIMVIMSAAGTRAQAGMAAFKKAATGLLEMTASILVVLFALDKLFKMELPEDYKTKLAILGGMFAALTVAYIAIGISSKKFGDGKVKFGPMILMTAAMYMMVKSVEKLFSLQLPEDYKTKLGILAGLFAGLALLYIAIGKSSKMAGGVIKAGGTILAMAVFVGVVVGSLVILAAFPGEKLLKGAVTLGLVLIALGSALGGAGKISGKDAWKSVLGMAVVVGTITAALGILSIVPVTKLLKSAVVLGSILLVLARDFKNIAKIKSEHAAKAVLQMSILVGMITISLLAIATQPIERIAAATVALSVTLLTIAHVLKKISGMTGLKPEKMKAFMTATLALIPIVLGIGILAFQPWDGLLAASASLSGVLLAFTFLLKNISKTTGLKKEKIALFLASTLSLIPIAISLGVLANQPWEGLLAAGASLSAVISAFSLAFLVIGKSKPDLKGIAVFAGATLAVGGIAVALYYLSEQPWEGLLSSATAISEVLLAMSIGIAICTKFASNVGAALGGIASLDLFIANFVLILAVLGKIFENPDAARLLNGGIDILLQLGDAIGGFIGHIADSFLTSATAGLADVADNLTAFAQHLEPFFEAIDGIDENALGSVNMLADAILALTKAQIMEQLTSWLTGGVDISAFAEEMKAFGPAIADFAETVKDVDRASVEGAASAASLLAETAENLPKHGGFWQELIGDASLTTFAEELTNFGPAIAEFGKTVAGIDASSVEGAASAAKIMGEVSENLPKHGGFWQDIIGDATLTTFAKELVTFGPAIRKFAGMVKDIDPNSVNGAATAAQVMAEVADKIPNSGGLIADFFGDNNIADFGRDLVTFGTYMRQFVEEVEGLNPLATVGVSVITATMTSLADNIPVTGSALKTFFRGDNNIANFGEDLAAFGKSFANFYDSISPIDATSLGAAITEFGKLVDLGKEISSDTGNSMNSFATALENLAQVGITGFVSTFQNGTTEAVAVVTGFVSSITATVTVQSALIASSSSTMGTNITTGINQGINAGKPLTLYMVSTLCQQIILAVRTGLPTNTFTNIGINLMTALNNGLTAKKALILATIKNLCILIIQEFKNNLSGSAIQSVGAALSQALADGINSKKSTVISAAASVGSAAVSSARDNCSYNEMYQIGANAGQGLANGLWGKVGETEAAAKALANAAAAAAKHTLNEHSPSKVMEEIGDYGGEGFIIGLIKWLTKSERTGSELADSVISPIQEAMTFIYTLLNQDFDLNPTITPTVDLSQVIEGVQKTNSIFSKGISLTRSYDMAMQTAAAFNTSRQPSGTTSSSLGNRNGEDRITNQFIQNNYSPKALSRSEIYRSTRNLFTQATGKVGKS